MADPVPTPWTASRLGYGCTEFFGVRVSRRTDALRILDTAWDHGIRHFDVARSYGDGLAEGLLGQFLADRRAQASITTKAGLFPPGLAGLKRLVKSVAAPLLKARARARNSGPRRVAAEAAVRGLFDPAALRASIETSLRELKCDRIDVLLLHEADAAAVADPHVRDLMVELKERNRVGAVGIGSAPRFVHDILDMDGQERAWLDVVQTANSFLRPMARDIVTAEGPALIGHSALHPVADSLALAKAQPELARTWSERLSCDLTDRRAVARLAMAYALASNPHGTAVFSSLSPSNIAANVNSLELATRLGPDDLAACDAFGKVLRDRRHAGPSARPA